MADEKPGETKQQKFCVLCGKYTAEDFKNLMIGRVGNVLLQVPGCPHCEVVISNIGRIAREFIAESLRKQKETQEKKVIAPGNEEGKILRPIFIPPKDVGKKS